jgi:hypothetical protein
VDDVATSWPREHPGSIFVSVARATDLDPAAEQLFDEILARSAAISEMVPAWPSPRPLRWRGGLIEASSRTVTSLRSGRDPDAGAGLIRAMWPTNTCPPPGHDWWLTPLGELLTDRRDVSRTGR